jgi:hypothetical protein
MMQSRDVQSPGSENPLVRQRRVMLRVLFGMSLVVGMTSGWVMMARQKADRQAEARDAIRQAGGRVYFDYQWRDGKPATDGVPPGAQWFRSLVGDEFLDRIVAVDLTGVEQPDELIRQLLLLPYVHTVRAGGTALSDQSLEVVGRLRGLRVLDLSGTLVTDAGVGQLGGLKQLQQLDVTGAAVSEKGVADLGRMLPKCRIVSTGGNGE